MSEATDSMKKMEKSFPDRKSLLIYFLRGAKKWFVCAIFSSMIVSVFDLINPKIIGFTVDSIIGEEASDLPNFIQSYVEKLGGRVFLTQHLYIVAAVVITLALIGGVFRYLSGLTNALGAERLLRNMRDDLYRHILSLPYRWHGENQTGDIIQRCTSDVETVKRFLSEQLTGLFRTVLLLGLSLYFMASISGALTAATAAFFPVIVLYSFFFESRISSAFRRCDEEEGKLSAIAQENLTGVRVVRAFGREKYERDRFETKNEYYTGMWVHMMRVLSQFWSTNDFISGLQALTVIALGAYFCVTGKITAGQYVTFVSYNSMITWPVRNLGRIISEMSKAGISIDRILYIMNAESEQEPGQPSKWPEHSDIVFENVTFGYGSGERKVLDNVSFRVAEGETVGILGGTGSGKSTLTALLDRLYELPEGQGTIRIGGTDIRNMTHEQVRSHVGLILQEPYLFSRTIAENIRIAADGADEAEIRRASDMASLSQAVEHFESGYDTMVGERGVTLSGGQKQRTAIAQMLIRRTPVRVFDDSLSAVDARTDALIRKAIRDEGGNSTVILISHRITTLMECDRIFVFDRGRLTESGTHEQLIAQNGIYHRIYALQTAQE